MSSPLEIFANGITTVSIFLAGRNSVHTWWTGNNRVHFVCTDVYLHKLSSMQM